MPEKTGTHNMQHGPHHIPASHPHNFATIAKNGKDAKHLKNANLGNSTSVVPDPKSVSRGLQSPQTSEAVPSNSKGALQHGTSIYVCRRPLDGDASARVVEVFTHVYCTWVGGDLGNCRNVEEIRKSILHGLEINIMEHTRHRTKDMSQRVQLASQNLPETSTQGFSNDLFWDPVDPPQATAKLSRPQRNSGAGHLHGSLPKN